MNALEVIKGSLLQAALEVVPFEGWSKRTMAQIDKAAGYETNTGEIVFPAGPLDIIDYFCEQVDLYVSQLSQASATTSVTQRIAEALCDRFAVYQSHRSFMVMSHRYMSRPSNIIPSAKIRWRTVDSIWRYAGLDKSTDFNYYTKRALLYGVYSSAFMYWLADTSPAFSDTRDYINRKLASVVKLGKKISALVNR